jgi:effector-binding domain-containing protein
MSATAEIENRPEQSYVAIRARVPQAGLGELGARFGEVFSWLAERGLAPAGAPFFRYRVIDMTRDLEVDAGVPVAASVAGDEHVVSDVIPAGRYATLTHVGPPAELARATKTLLDWAAAQGLAFDMSSGDSPDDAADSSPGEDGERWGGRLEIYLTDPSQEPDMSKWVTQLAFRLA